MGLLDGLFGKKSTEDKSVDEVSNGNAGAYFLEQDDAKSLGNIEYMRTAKAVKKTFPGIAGREGFEVVETISNMEKQQEGKSALSQNNGFASNGYASAAQSDTPATTTGEVSERRRSDSSMDLFRSMARDIKKKD